VVANALRACGVHVELKTDHFAPDAKDVDWLPVVGRKGWVILTKDKRICQYCLELVSLLRSGTASFVLTSGTYSGQDRADAFVRALPHMKRMLAKHPRPFVATVSKAGTPRLQYTFDGLIRKASSSKSRHDKKKT